jgi:hypothetical protein
MSDRRLVRTLVGLLVVAVLAVGGWVVAEQRAADLDAAANGVLATSSGANDAITNARLMGLFADLTALDPLRAGLAAGAFAAVALGAGIAVVLIGRARGRRPARPVPGAALILTLLGVAALAASVAVVLQQLFAVYTDQDGITRATSGGTLDTASLAFWSLTPGALLIGGFLAFGAAILGPVLAGRRARPRIIAALALVVVLLALAVPAVALTSTTIAVDWLGDISPRFSRAGSTPAYAARLVNTAPATAAGILFVATIAVGALARRRDAA